MGAFRKGLGLNLFLYDRQDLNVRMADGPRIFGHRSAKPLSSRTSGWRFWVFDKGTVVTIRLKRLAILPPLSNSMDGAGNPEI